MSYSNPSWSDFSDAGIGPKLPLDESQRVQMVSGVLPSGESGGLDFIQYGSKINDQFPYPNLSTQENRAFTNGESREMFPDKFSDEWWDASGILDTSPEDSGVLFDPKNESTIFHFNGSVSRFSNGEEVKSNQISDFKIFNPYIHHELSSGKNKRAVEIPFISTSTISLDFRPYG
jgi:hypothetical protein